MEKKVTSKANKKTKQSPQFLTGPKKFGEKASDAISKWAGSWTFILAFAMLLIIWMLLNTIWATQADSWDPYPFILLNLVLSCIAAFQAPIILMSQNRAAEKDRQRSEYDYAVNRKAEREIKELKKLIARIDRRLTKDQ